MERKKGRRGETEGRIEEQNEGAMKERKGRERTHCRKDGNPLGPSSN
jgi:hypothetical protein